MEKTIRIKNATKLGYLIAKEGDGIDLQFPSSTKRRGRVQPQMIQTLDCSGGGTKGVAIDMKTDGLRIRKLTPKECWRLMGFKDNEFEAAEKTNSNAQLYKQAGNSIVVDVLVNIFDKLLSDYKE